MSSTKSKTIGKAAPSVQTARQGAAHTVTTNAPVVAKKDSLSAVVQRAQNAQPVVQQKIKMGVVGDAHEQQADAMAEQVLSMSNEQVRRQHLRVQPKNSERPQRKEEVKKKDEVQKKEELKKQELRKKDELKKKEELQKQELKKKDELKKKEELQKQELKKKDELKKKEELQKQELKKKDELKKKEELQKQELKKKDELKKKEELQKQELKKKDEPLKKKADEKIQKQQEVQKVAVDKVQPKIVAAMAVQPKEELKKKADEKVQKQPEVQKAAAEKVQPKIVAAATVQTKEELKKKADEKVQKQPEVKKAAAEKVQPKIVAAAAVQTKEELKKKGDDKLQKQQEVQKAANDKAQPKLVATKMRDQREMERDIKPALPVQSNMQAAVSIQQKALDTTQKEKPSEEVRRPGTLPVSSGMQSAMSQEQHKLSRKEDKVQSENAVAVEAPQDEVPPHIEEQLKNVSGGRPMEPGIRGWMEQRFGVSFAAVRIHTDSQAIRLCNELGAHAFAYGSNIFFNAGKYDPESTEGKRLLAHELTHVIQQGYAPESNSDAAEASAQVQQSTAPEVKKSAPEVKKSAPEVQKAEPVAQRLPGGVSNAPLSVQRGIWDRVNNAVRYVVPPWTLITVIFGYNPILGASVARSPINWFNALLDLIPVVGPAIFDLLRSSGMLNRAQQWLDAQLARLPSLSEISSTWDRCWEEMGIRHGIDGNIAIFRRHFGSILSRIGNFVWSALAEVVRLLRETLLRPLDNVIKDIPGWTLITAMIGLNPLTGERVERNATNILRGVAAFIPGGEERFNQLVESRALERAYQWFVTETTARNLTWPRIQNTFQQAWNTLRAEDILHPIDTFRRLAGIFSPLLRDLVSFCGAALLKLLEFIFEAVMGAGGADVLAIIKRARESFTLIIQNPVGFVGNLLRGIGQGVRQFMGRILTHLQQGVIRWLTGPVARAGIQMPPQWDAKGILFFVLQILGLTYDNIRGKMVRLMGERTVGMLETGFQLVQEIREKGFVEAMKDRISEFFGNFRDMILGRIKSFIQERIVTAGITQLLSMLSPVGAVIQAIIKTHTTIKFFIDKIQQILAFVRSVVDSVHRLATGDVSGAANFIESSIAQTIPIVLDFLARFIGLGDVGAHVQRTIGAVRGWVDQKLDLGVNWIRTQFQRLMAAGSAAVRRIRQWFRVEKPVTLRNGEAHTLRMDPQAPNGRLQIHTDPQPFVQWVNNNFGPAPQVGTTPARTANPLHPQLLAAAQNIETLQTNYSTATNDADRVTISNNISAAINALAALLGTITPPATIPLGGTTIPIPPTIFTYGGVNANGYGQWAKAEYLSQNAVSRGSINNEARKIRDRENVTGWNIVRRRLRINPPHITDAARYENSIASWFREDHGFVRGHLMNGKLGGGAFPYNLTPITDTANNTGNLSHYNQVENTLQTQIAVPVTSTNPVPNVFNYEIHAIYGTHAKRSIAPLQTLIDQSDLAYRINRGHLRTLPQNPATQALRQALETKLYNGNRVYMYARYEMERLSYEENNLPLGFMTEYVLLRPNTANPPRWAPLGNPISHEIYNVLPPFTVNAGATSTAAGLTS
ncbi:MAG: DUF4157 domain-containing protein [Bacteroidetes bacterium]|nr:DUF4157 domain-containing protein [Bacteroidota bacterium]